MIGIESGIGWSIYGYLFGRPNILSKHYWPDKNNARSVFLILYIQINNNTSLHTVQSIGVEREINFLRPLDMEFIPNVSSQKFDRPSFLHTKVKTATKSIFPQNSVNQCSKCKIITP